MENTPQTEELNKEDVKPQETSAEQNLKTEENQTEEVILSRSDFKNIIETLLFITDKP